MRVLFPGAWRHYDVVVAACLTVVVAVNTLLAQTEHLPGEDWFNVAAAFAATLLILIRARRVSLGQITKNGE